MPSPDLTPAEHAAFGAIHGALCSLTCTDGGSAAGPYVTAARAAVVAVEPLVRGQVLAEVLPLINDLTDEDDCWFDHHGGCQAHGYLSLGPGERCPHQEAKELLAAHHWNDAKDEVNP